MQMMFFRGIRPVALCIALTTSGGVLEAATGVFEWQVAAPESRGLSTTKLDELR